MMALDSVVIPHTDLSNFIAATMERLGAPPDAARLTADSLVSANLRGVDSHGVQLTVAYAGQIRKGHMDPRARGNVASENGACLVYDGENGLGQVVSDICTDHAIRLAREQGGLGMVVARRSNHYGASAWWAQKIARAGMIGFASCNATALVAAWQGRDKIIGTNPICMAVPGPDTFLLDMATTTVALNKIHKARLTGETSIPLGWALDSEGRPTTDPQTAIAGLPMPLGGYKGSGLAVMVEILCSVLSGGAMLTQMGQLWDSTEPMSASQYFLAVDVSRFLPLTEFAGRMQFIHQTVTGSRPAAGYDEVLIAGEPEWRTQENRKRDGIPLPKGVWKHLVELGASVQLSAPAHTEA
jgi:LDH2 family malate/lactate/ureidoglycolate dehydrogenase